MKRRVNYLALAALLLATSANAFADVAPPDKVKTNSPKGSSFNARMHIDPTNKGGDAKLLIPRSLLQQMKAGLDGEDSHSAALTYFNTGGGQTLMAGLFLSLAFAFGGVWFVRSRGQRRFGPASLSLAARALCGLAATAAYANAGPPPVARSLTSKILIEQAQWYGVYGDVKVEVVDDDDQIRLVLPKGKDEKPQ